MKKLGLLLAIAFATQVSCQVNDYCLNCDTGDGGGSNDANTDGPKPTDGSGSGSGSCVPTGPEICDNLDNDCDGKIDEQVAEVGQACANQKGECAGGTITCTAGKLGCTKSPQPEICDNKDNDCDGVNDNNNPLIDSAGNVHSSKCGNGTGECKQGDNICTNGVITCTGGVNPVPETCDGKDNDCDGVPDNGLDDLGTCGTNNTSPCHFGHLACVGGGVVCQDDKEPGFETCNNADDDCDGVIDNGFDTKTDPLNCGACGNVCNLPFSVNKCSGSTCGIAACQPGHFNNDGNVTNGCEYACTVTGVEVCDGKDNDCNGKNITPNPGVDDGLTAPNICATKGECAGTTAQCDGSDGFQCHYDSTVETEGGDGVTIVPQETLCDHLDNDCDGRVDEGTPGLGASCQVGTCKTTGGDCFADTDCAGAGNKCLFAGRCGGTGHTICNPADATAPPICVVDTHGQTPQTESCNGIDDDCDGVVDNGGSTGSLVGQDWIDIGNGKQMMKWEASKPDASDTADGNITTGTVCSKQNVIPWTNITYPQALAACQSVGASLCTEQEWHRTCSVVSTPTYPISLPASGSGLTVVQAEDYFSVTPATGGGIPRTWIEDYVSNFTGISAMAALPDTGGDFDTTSVVANSPRLDYQFKMTKASATYTVWVLISQTTGAGNRVFIDIDKANLPKVPNDTTFRISSASGVTYTWLKASHTFTLAAGIHTLNVYMGRDGVRIDAVAITDDASTPALPTDGQGGHWAYATSQNTYQSGVCNDQNFSAANDNVLKTGGASASCRTTTNIFDMSGNVKEWAIAREPGENPIRGGASNSPDQGISCPLNFTLGDDSFFFSNVGFRCCRVHP